MAHHPFPARLRIPTQNVGTGGIRGSSRRTGWLRSILSSAAATHDSFAARKASPSRTEHPAGKVRRTSPDGRTDTEIRRARRVPNTVTSPKQDALPSSSHLLYPFGSGTAGTSAPSFRPRLFVPSACPCGSPRPQTPLTAPALRQGCCDSPHAALFRTVPPPRSVNPLAHRFKQQHGRGSRNVQRLDGPDDGYGQLHVAQFKNLL